MNRRVARREVTHCGGTEKEDAEVRESKGVTARTRVQTRGSGEAS